MVAGGWQVVAGVGRAGAGLLVRLGSGGAWGWERWVSGAVGHFEEELDGH